MILGFVHDPEKTKVISQTSKTLRLSWEAKTEGCYAPENFELRFPNGSLLENIAYPTRNCFIEYQLWKCKYRIKDLQPKTNYEWVEGLHLLNLCGISYFCIILVYRISITSVHDLIKSFFMAGLLV